MFTGKPHLLSMKYHNFNPGVIRCRAMPATIAPTVATRDVGGKTMPAISKRSWRTAMSAAIQCRRGVAFALYDDASIGLKLCLIDRSYADLLVQMLRPYGSVAPR